ncbi:hypothetical protein TcWFU_008828 [Taenia crassiceps]|uniref:Uncharacterized protein n=1 Tax=Taenia crassiceps TaxID=6207 RepID=A0ABR4Q9U0_9CEST
MSLRWALVLLLGLSLVLVAESKSAGEGQIKRKCDKVIREMNCTVDHCWTLAEVGDCVDLRIYTKEPVVQTKPRWNKRCKPSRRICVSKMGGKGMRIRGILNKDPFVVTSLDEENKETFKIIIGWKAKYEQMTENFENPGKANGSENNWTTQLTGMPQYGTSKPSWEWSETEETEEEENVSTPEVGEGLEHDHDSGDMGDDEAEGSFTPGMNDNNIDSNVDSDGILVHIATTSPSLSLVASKVFIVAFILSLLSC